MVTLAGSLPALGPWATAGPPPELRATPPPQTVNLSASADAYVLDVRPLRNFGASPSLFVGREPANGSVYRSLLGFDLSPIPPYAIVANATLRVHALDATGAGSVDVHRVRAPWTEGTGLEVFSLTITVRETANLPRTREPVVVRVAIGGGGIPGEPASDFLLFDPFGIEVPSQVFNVTRVNNKVVGVDIAFASSHAPSEVKEYTLLYGLPPGTIPPYRTRGLSPVPLWTFPGGSVASSPAIGDLNGDGIFEVVFATASGEVVDVQWDGSTATTLWTYSVPDSLAFSPVIADLTGNGDREVLFATTGSTPPFNHSVTALSGTGRYLWHTGFGGTPIVSFTAADTDSDGVVEVFVATGTSYPSFSVLRGDSGGAVCTFANTLSTGTVNDISVGNVAGSVAPDIVVTDGDGHVRVRRPDCGPETPGNAKPGATGVLTVPTLANLTSDAVREILVGDRGGSLSREFLLRGADLASLAASAPVGSNLAAGQLVLDADGDGAQEVYFLTSGDGALRRATGGLNLTWTFLPSANGGAYAAPSAADVNGDGRPEILFGTDGTSLEPAAVYAVGHNGTEVTRWTLGSGVQIRGPPLAADLDGDGTLDLVVATDNSTDASQTARVYVFGTGSLGHDYRAGSYTNARTGLWLDGNSPDGEALLEWTLSTTDPPLVAGVTWATRDGTNPWANPGADIDPVPLSTAVPATGAWAAWNVTGVLQGWVNGSSPSTGFALKSSDEAVPWNLTFASREYGPGFAPELMVTFTADPSPRIVGTIPDQVETEDSPPWTLDLLPYASDPDTPATLLRWGLAGINATFVQVQGTNVSGNHVLTFRAAPDAYGVEQGDLFLVDERGNFDSRPIRIELIPVNDAPAFNPPGVLYARYDVPYTFDFDPYMSDVDTPIGLLGLATNDTVHTSVAGHRVTFTYPRDYTNRWSYVILTVTDPARAGASQVVAIWVSSDFPPELTQPLPDVTLVEGETRTAVFDLDNYFLDPDSDALFYTYGENHLIVTIRSDHTVDMSAPTDWTGVEQITFRAEDPTGAIAEDTILAIVVPVDDPPVVAAPPPLAVHYDYPFQFDLTPYVRDSDTPMERLVVSTSNPSNVSVAGMVLTLVYPERLGALTAPYAVPLTIIVRDDTTAVSATTSVTVQDNFPPRLSKSLPDLSFPEDTVLAYAFDLDGYFLDIDGSVALLTARATNLQVTIHPDHNVSVSAPTNWSGAEFFTIRATDDRGAIVEDSAFVIVTPVNDAPSILALPPQIHEGLGSWFLDLTPFVEDSDNIASELSVSTGGHPRVTAAGMYLVFDYGREAFHETVTVLVSDGELSVQAVVEVDVRVPSPFLPFVPVIAAGAVAVSVFLAHRVFRTRIEEVFLVHNSGLAVAHLSRTLTPDRDTDLVTAMFTAIQLFAKHSVGQTRGKEMVGMSFGRHQVTIAHGELAYLAVVFTGVRRLAERRIHRRAEAVLREVEERHGRSLKRWSGMVSEVAEIRSHLETFFGAKETGIHGIASEARHWSPAEIAEREVKRDRELDP